MEDKALNVVNGQDAQQKVSDVEFFGNPDTWMLVCKASSKEQGWMKSTKVLNIPGCGCFLQVTTQQGNQISEAVTWAPRVQAHKDRDGFVHFSYIG